MTDEILDDAQVDAPEVQSEKVTPPYMPSYVDAEFIKGLTKSFGNVGINPGQAVRYHAINGKALELAIMLSAHCPPSRERALAITNLEQAIHWACAAIALNE